MIHLVSVAKIYPRPNLPPRLVFQPTNVSVPTDRRVAVLAKRRQGKTTLLQLLSRQIRPDQGVIVGAQNLSPVINAGGVLHPQLSAIDNITFLARTYGLDTILMVQFVEHLVGDPIVFDQPLRTQTSAYRKILEAAIVLILPFECYLLDEIGQFESGLIERCLEAAEHQNAGFIFSTSQPRLVQHYAEQVVIINDGIPVLFDTVKDGLRAFEQTAV